MFSYFINEYYFVFTILFLSNHYEKIIINKFTNNMGGNSSSCRTSQYRAQIRNNEDVHERIKKTYDSIEKLKQMTQNGMVTQEELENKVESIEEENRQLREAAEKCPDDSALKRALEAINELVCEIGRAVGRGIRAVFDVIGRAIKGIGNVIARALTAIGNVISSCLKAIGNLLSRFFSWIGSWFS
uniref:Uncharacterized protein n=4 Tax=Meloidogyne TaxID=189290 RepID=A0A6V7X311_MELEN|nr:unnamed protein product [Meloidogyne enterolobii]